MSELEAAAAIEAIDMDVEIDEDKGSGARCDEHAGNITSRRIRQGTSGDKENDADNPTANGERVPPFHMCSSPPIQSPIPQPQYPLTFSSSPCAGARQPGSPNLELHKEQVAERARAMFLGGVGDPVRSGERPIASEATNDLVFLAKTVVLELFEQRRSEVRMVSETARLDQEEAVAYLLGDVLGYELLPAEARPIGKAAQHAAAVFRGKPKGSKAKPSADQRLKDKASTDRSKARAAAAKSEALAAGLDARLAAIDERLAADRRELASTVVALPWPDRRSVVCERAEPKPRAEVDALARLRADAEKAETAATRADADAVAAHRRLERMKARLDKLAAKRLAQSTCGWRLSDEGYQVLLKERAETDAEYEQVRAMWSELLRAHAAAQCTAEDARHAAEVAREAVADEEESRSREAAWERETQEREAKYAAEREAWQREWEAEEAAAAERRAELTARLAALERMRTHEPWRWESPEETRVRLHGGAELVWGSVEGRMAAPPPKVFKLTGMSAEQIRGLASEVSQESTDVEETVALNRSGLS
jgi:hypothetical protein